MDNLEFVNRTDTIGKNCENIILNIAALSLVVRTVT